MNAKDLSDVLDHVIHNVAFVPVSKELYQQMVDYDEGRDNVAAHVEFQLEAFLERMNEESITRKPETVMRGVFFGNRLLPHGTQLRTKYYGEWKQAQVSDGKVLWDDQEYESIAKACNAMRGDTSNNAWLVLEVKKPDESSFRPANRLRK